MRQLHTIVLFWVLFFATQTYAEIVGTTKGSFSVNQGTAHYNLKIEVPPGVAGMVPGLSLDYSSSGNNGHMGIGWNIGGISSISRCAQIKAVDGETFMPRIRYDSNDSFCLDGRRLINISGDYGTPGSEYRTEIDSYSKIVAQGSMGDGPEYFEVKTKSGLTYTYGKENASSLEAVTNSSARFWKISKISDTFGNDIQFFYFGDKDSGTHYLSKVSYADTEIVYEYEDRLDVLKGYEAGNPLLIDKRLVRVIVKLDNEEIRRYTMTYENESSGAQRSKVSSITQQAADGGELATLYMTYDESGETGFSESTAITIPDEVTEDAAFIDLNGDGFVDIASQDKLWTNKGDGTFNDPVALEVGDGVVMTDRNETWKLDDIENRFRTYVDYEGDGDIDCFVVKLDYIINRAYPANPALTIPVYVYRIYKYLNDGEGGMVPDLDSDKNNTIISLQQYKILSSSGEAFKYVDFNNDGVVDILATSWLGTEYDNTEYTISWESTADEDDANGYKGHIIHGIYDVFVGNLHVFDINGDGYSDIFSAEYGLDKNNLILLNDGLCSDSNIYCYFIPTDSFTNTWSSLLKFADLNGDSLVDVYEIKENGADIVWLNKGDGNFVNSFSPDPEIGSSGDFKFADVNHDGYPDMYIINSGDDKVWLNNGQGNFTSESYSVAVEAVDSNLTLADLNGDGTVEIVEIGETKKVWTNHAKQPLLIQVTNNIDQDIKIDYKPMADGEVYRNYSNTGLRNSFPWNDIANDNIELTTTNSLVYKVQSANGKYSTDGYNTLRYKYFGYVVNKLRGPQGFRDIDIYNETTGMVSRTTYKQVDGPNGQGFQYTGMPYYLSVRESKSQPTELLSKTSIQYESRTIQGDVNGTIYQPYAFKSINYRYDPDDVETLLSKTTKYSCIDDQVHYGDAICLDATLPSASAEQNVGNVLKSVVKTEDRMNNGKTSTKSYYNEYASGASDIDAWIIGRVSKVTVTHEQDGNAAITKSSTFTYSQDKGILSESVVNADTDWALTNSYTYDSFGNIKSETVTGSGIMEATSTYGYSDDGKFLTSVTNAAGLQETRTYDPRFGTVKTLTGPNNITTEWKYDGLGRKTAEYRENNTTQTTWSYHWWSNNDYKLNDSGVYYVVTLSSGEPMQIDYYDAFGRETFKWVDSMTYDGYVGQRKEYNEKGELIRESLPYTDKEVVVYTKYTYDRFGRVTGVDKPGPGGTTQTYTTEYNNFTVTVTDPKGNKKQTVKNAIGQVVSVTDAYDSSDASTMYYTYDAAGNLVQTVNTASAASAVTIEYDAAGNKMRMVDPDLGEWHYRYNAAGQITQQWSGTENYNNSRHFTLNTYDVLGRTVEVKVNDRKQQLLQAGTHSNVTKHFTYGDANASVGSRGKLLEAFVSSKTDGMDYHTHTETYTYDVLGRATNLNTRISGRGGYNSSITYDAFSRPDVKTYPNGYTVTYSYDTRTGLLKRLTGSDGKVHYTINELSAFGAIHSATFGNGVKTIVGYDDAGFAGNIVSYTGSPILADVQRLDYTYDVAGNVKTRQDTSISGKSILDTYTYDAMNRLYNETTESDVIGNYRTNTNYRYDALGNMTFKGGLGWYTYDPVKVHALMQTETGAQVKRNYVYDEVGNMVSRNGDTIDYNPINKPVRMLNGTNGKEVKFYYGVGDARYKKSVTDGNVTYYIGKGYEEQVEGHEEKEICYITVGGKTVGTHTEVKNTYYVPTNPNYLQETYNRYFHTDALGSITAITDDNANVVERRSYDAFGKIRAMDYGIGTNGIIPVNTVAETTRAYTGHEQLAELSGLVHMNARVYDSDLGRFLSADTIVPNPYDSQSFNRYSYVQNNPLNYVDPTGHESLGSIEVYGGDPLVIYLNDLIYSTDTGSDYNRYIIYGSGSSSSDIDSGYSDYSSGHSSGSGSSSGYYNYEALSETSFSYTGNAGGRYGFKGMGDIEYGRVVYSAHFIRVPEPRTITVPSAHADLTKFYQKSPGTVFHPKSTSSWTYSNVNFVPMPSDWTRPMSAIDVFVVDYGYDIFTTTPIGDAYDTIAQYNADQLSMAAAGGLLLLSAVPGGSFAKKAYKASKGIRQHGPWTREDIYMGLKHGSSPKSFGYPELHHRGQMPGAGIDELSFAAHRGKEQKILCTQTSINRGLLRP